MNIQKILDSADKAKKLKKKKNRSALVQTVSVMDMLVDRKIAQLDFFEDAAERGDSSDH